MFAGVRRWQAIFPDFDAFAEFLRWSDVHHHAVTQDGAEITGFNDTIGNLIHHCSSYTNPKYRLDEMDFIARLENLEADMQEVNSRIDGGLSIGHLRQGSGPSYQSVYTPRARAIITDLYARDLERFSYRF